MRGQFRNIAHVFKEARVKTVYSQSEVSHLLGYSNGQFISNVERALCSVPLKKLVKVCEILKIEPSTIKEAMMRDLGDTLDIVLTKKEVKDDAATDAP